MTGAELVDLCEARFGDTANSVYSATEWLAYVNAAYREFVRVAKWPSLLAETTAVIAAGGRSVALPSAALQGGVVAVFTSAGDPLEKQPADLPNRTVRHLTDRDTKPVFYDIQGGRLVILPGSSAGETLTLSYLIAPTALTTLTSPVIPATYDDTLVAGALSRAYRDDGNADAAKQYTEEFMAMATTAATESKDAP
jgi:hypothetical protein